mgnify:CR=1 FL=1
MTACESERRRLLDLARVARKVGGRGGGGFVCVRLCSCSRRPAPSKCTTSVRKVKSQKRTAKSPASQRASALTARTHKQSEHAHTHTPTQAHRHRSALDAAEERTNPSPQRSAATARECALRCVVSCRVLSCRVVSCCAWVVRSPRVSA